MARVRTLVRVSVSPGRIVEAGTEIDVAPDVAAPMLAAGQIEIVDTGSVELEDPPSEAVDRGEESDVQGDDPPSGPVPDGGEPPPAEDAARMVLMPRMVPHDDPASTTRVSGIGPVTADALCEAARISTLTDLAGLSDVDIEALGGIFGGARLTEWRAAARAIAGRDTEPPAA